MLDKLSVAFLIWLSIYSAQADTAASKRPGCICCQTVYIILAYRHGFLTLMEHTCQGT